MIFSPELFNLIDEVVVNLTKGMRKDPEYINTVNDVADLIKDRVVAYDKEVSEDPGTS